MPIRSFPPIYDARARCLVLGSMPSLESLARGEYYAHPRNAFWDIVAAYTGVARSAPYPERTEALRRHGIALWDVLASCEREGSVDSAIERASEVPNDFKWLHTKCPRLERVLWNGGKARAAWIHHVIPAVPEAARLRGTALPSTSPAMASLSLRGKVEAWRVLVA